MIEIVLLGKAVPKGRPRFNRETGTAHTPKKTATYEGELKFAALQAMIGKKPLEGPLSLDMVVVVPIAPSWSKKRQAAARAGTEMPTGKPDFDNYQKTVDALNLIVWADDGQIVQSSFLKCYGDKPGMWIKVRPYQPTEDVFG